MTLLQCSQHHVILLAIGGVDAILAIANMIIILYYVHCRNS